MQRSTRQALDEGENCPESVKILSRIKEWVQPKVAHSFHITRQCRVIGLFKCNNVTNPVGTELAAFGGTGYICFVATGFRVWPWV